MANPHVRRAHPSVDSERRALFLSHIDKTEDGCWLWQGWINPGGYGRALFNRYSGQAHRLSYEIHVGPIPEGLTLDHLCRVRHCVNPAHLEPVTHRENVRRGRNAATKRTHCPHGHPYDEANTYINPRGDWECRACRTIRRVIRQAAEKQRRRRGRRER